MLAKIDVQILINRLNKNCVLLLFLFKCLSLKWHEWKLYNLWIFTSFDQKDLLDFEVQIIESQLHTPLFCHTKNSSLKFEKAFVFHNFTCANLHTKFLCNTFRGARFDKPGSPRAYPKLKPRVSIYKVLPFKWQ